jgi:hypothetical protein
MTRHIVIATMLLVVALAPSAAWPADIEGKIQSVDAGERTLTLDNGTKIWLSDGIALDAMKEGAQVKVSYEDKDGKPVATSVEVK